MKSGEIRGQTGSPFPEDRKTIQYVYDALYRLSSKTYPDTTNVEYVYDLAGKVQQVSDPTGTYGFAYDNMGRLIANLKVAQSRKPTGSSGCLMGLSG